MRIALLVSLILVVPAAGLHADTHVVQPGDSLWSIARDQRVFTREPPDRRRIPVPA